MVFLTHRAGALEAAEGRGLMLSGEQRDAFDRITEGQGLASVIGYAGTGKSAMLGVAREAWEREGYQVRARPCPGSRPRIWRGIGHQLALSPALNMHGRRAATSFPAMTCWWWTRRA
jgi:ATP-dependent exoDNAse (exonuclease V) alpha subunit